MEDFGFNIDGLLSQDEADKLFREDSIEENENDTMQDIEPEEKKDDAEEQDVLESVGKKEENDKVKEDAEPEKSEGTSPNVFYSSIANALKDDGIFPDLDEETIKGIKSPEDFGELFEKAVNARLDEKQKRIDAALDNGIQPDIIKQYEQTIQYLNSIDDDALSEDGDKGEDLRRQILYNDFINRGFSQERANREVKKAIDAATDYEDAREALESLKDYYNKGYKKVQDEAAAQKKAFVEQQKKNAEDFRKLILDSDIVLGDQKLDKNVRQKVYDAVSKPVYKDPDSGKLLTQVQKFQKDNPLEFLKQLGLWYVLTNGGKDMVGFTKNEVRKEKHKALRDLENKITATSINSDGSLRFATGDDGSKSDILLDENWKIG